MNTETAKVGAHAEFSKTISESDIYLFAGLTGDLHPIHVNDVFARSVGQPGRIAHGLLVLGIMGTAGAVLVQRLSTPTVSYGYDHVRFIKPVMIGDTITSRYEITAIEEDGRKIHSQITCQNQHGDTVASAQHISYVISKT